MVPILFSNGKVKVEIAGPYRGEDGLEFGCGSPRLEPRNCRLRCPHATGKFRLGEPPSLAGLANETNTGHQASIAHTA